MGADRPEHVECKDCKKLVKVGKMGPPPLRCAGCKRLLAQAKNNDAKRAKDRATRRANPESNRARVRTWAANNPEKARKSVSNWRINNPEKYTEQKRRTVAARKINRVTQPMSPPNNK